MDGRSNHWADESAEHMWLRYATQFIAKGRTFNVEVSVPIPLGASAERREQLLQEADMNISQLVQHVERYVPQAIQRALATNNAAPAQAAKPPVPSRPINQAAPVPAPPAMTQPSQPARTASSPAREVQEQPARMASQNSEAPSVARSDEAMGIELPPDLAGDGSGNLLLPQFIQYIRANLGLTPQQAMKLLEVKTLSGVNLRDALERLRHLVGQPGAGGVDASKVQQQTREATSSSAQMNSRSRDNGSETERHELNIRNMREIRPAYVFEEEDDPDEDEEVRDDLDDEELDEFGLSEELTTQQRARARTVISRLRESRGATTVNPSRLQALSNVADSQISKEQLQDLVSGVWGVTSLRKLKVDQVEALISWAKEDDFVSEVEAVLTLLEEE
ncbi:MAG TPA: hypothetical protein VKY19_19880 [Ktedonosporobacter sp.]|jgi:hypothetical protein|nr:hypothetical protein [Ktedonosporobacter sp.]